MIRGLVSGILAGGLVLLFAVIMLSAFVPILMAPPSSETVAQDRAATPDAAETEGAVPVASERQADQPAPDADIGAAQKESAATAVENAAGDPAAAETGSARPEPAPAATGGAEGGAEAVADRPRRVAPLPMAPGAGEPPVALSTDRPARPASPAVEVGAAPAPDPITGQAGPGRSAASGDRVAALPGAREAAPPPAPRRDAQLPARPASPAGRSNAAGEDPGGAVEKAAKAPSSAADPAVATGGGLQPPAPDASPADRLGGAPAARPETGGPATLGARPQTDAAPDAPVLSVAPPVSAQPPAAPAAPEIETALAAPGLPGRTLQSTPAAPAAAPEISDGAPRIGQFGDGPRLGAPPAPSVAALPGPGVAAAPPQVGASAPGGARADADAAPTPAPEREAAREDKAGTAAEAPAAALPRVRRPGAGEEEGVSGVPGAGFLRPGADGPTAPTAPGIQERALPAPGFSGSRTGVRTGRLPQIGAEQPGTAESAPAEAPGPGAAAETGPDAPLARFSQPFSNPDGLPRLAIILLDDGAGGDRLANLDLPVTVALDPAAPGAAAAAARYRAAGKEVLILANALPPGASAADVEVSLAGMFAAVPPAVGVLDTLAGGFQNDRIRARHVVEILGAEGYGLLTHDRGLNAAAQLAEQAALPVGRVFRALDAEGEDEETIRRYLDRAAFRAAQQGTAIVLGHNRPETVAALIGWAMEGRARGVALAPVTAALTRN